MNTKTIYKLLENIKDPEIPVVSIVDMGIVRNIKIDNNTLKIDLSPTYSGCPAMDMIKQDVISLLNLKTNYIIEVNFVIKPAWTTDWISEKGKKNMMDYGICPPEKITINKRDLLPNKSNVICPKCKSKDTELISQFGSTPCKALYKCIDCLESFDYFKCI